LFSFNSIYASLVMDKFSLTPTFSAEESRSSGDQYVTEVGPGVTPLDLGLGQWVLR